MFARIRRLIHQLFRRSSTINNEPLNKVSLIVLILIDIFILSNVFWGLADISQWHLSPEQAYPCYQTWQSYRQQTTPTQTRDYEFSKSIIAESPLNSFPYSPEPNQDLRQAYQNLESGHLGRVSPVCLEYAGYVQALKTASNRQIIKNIAQTESQIANLEAKNRQIREQYDSTLLEQIAGQPRSQSINSVAAEKAKQQLDQNKQQIASLQKTISQTKAALLGRGEVKRLLAFLQSKPPFDLVESGYRQASFWYPTIQLSLQALFLLPLLVVALTLHRFAQRKGYGLMALLSWHLLVIFTIPLVLKIFEFLQVGALLTVIINLVQQLFGGLLFLVSYLYILLIPLLGFGIIKFFQALVFNPKVQAVSRTQKSRCPKCAKKLRPQDAHCPYCGFNPYLECPNCHNLTYKYLPYCKICGHAQDPNHLG